MENWFATVLWFQPLAFSENYELTRLLISCLAGQKVILEGTAETAHPVRELRNTLRIKRRVSRHIGAQLTDAKSLWISDALAPELQSTPCISTDP